MIAVVLAVFLQTLSSTWQVVRVGDAMTDQESVIADSELGNERLVVGCMDGDVMIQRQTTRVLGESMTSRRRTEPTYRFDQRTPGMGRWIYSMRGAGMMGQDAEAFMQGMVGASEVLTRLVTFEGVTVDTTFPLENALASVNEAREACGLAALGR